MIRYCIFEITPFGKKKPIISTKEAPLPKSVIYSRLRELGVVIDEYHTNNNLRKFGECRLYYNLTTYLIQRV